MSKNILTKLMLLVALLCGITTAHADRYNEQARYAGFTALPAASQDDVVFIGNSITHMMNWWETLGNRHNIHGRGNSGAKTYQALDNLESMIAGQPAKAFVMLGTNDLGNAVTELYNKLYNVDDAPGQYSTTSVEEIEGKIAEACKVLWNTTITTEQAKAAIAPLSTITFTLNRAKVENLLPRPQQASLTTGTFTGRIADATVTVDASAIKTFDYAVDGFDNEGYSLSITPTGIVIKAASNVGVIRAKQTLRQLIPDNATLDYSDLAAIDAAEVTLECCEITDYPAFKVRGYMHDVGRSYISFEELKKEIDLLSRFKVNVFHWHLTDNHAFRFESKTHPAVNTKFERFPQGIYTQEQCRELDAYAAERGIIIIPEIDMPGHSRQFRNATGYDMTTSQGKAILKDILGELAECFTHAPYIHVGADESGATVAYVKEMTDHVHSLGKKTVCWNTYGTGALVTPKTMGVDMLTNWATSGRKVDGVPNIDMRYFYVNHFDVFADLAGAYRSLILDAERGNANIGGVSIGIWNDRYLGDERQIIAQNNVYATVIAMTERAWVGGAGHQYIERGGAYLPNEGRDHDEYCDWERRFLYYKDKWLADEPIPYVKSSNVIWNITPAYDNKGNMSATFDPETPGAELTPQPGSTFATGAGQWLNHIWNSTVTGVIGSQSYNQTRYAWTYVYSPVEQEVGAQIEFRNYSRSDGGLVPQNKKWDIMGSRVWVNDVEVLPAWNWTNANTNPDLEKELGNLNFPGRAPVKVQLQEGWNKVLLKCPFIDITNAKGRRNKWQYTFVFTDLDGKHAVEGLIYSPNRLLEGENFSIPPIAGDLQGRRVSSSSKGLVVRGGKIIVR